MKKNKSVAELLREKGFKEGYQEGILLAQKALALKALDLGISEEQTAQLMGLTIAQVRAFWNVREDIEDIPTTIFNP